MRVTLFFTKNISLKDWEQAGLLDREILLYKKLQKLYGVNFTFITYGNKDDVGVDKSFDILPLNVYENRPFKIYKFYRLISLYHQNLKNSDIFKTNQMDGAMTAVISKIFYRKKLLLRTGYSWYEFSKSLGQPKYKNVYKYIYSLICYKFSDYIFVVTESEKKRIIKTFRLKSEKIIVMSNWVDTSRFYKENNIRTNEFLYIGRLEQGKGVLETIDLLHRTEWKLNVFGEGTLKQKLIDHANLNNVNIEIHGILPNNLLPEIYNKYKYFILNSNSEGMSKVLLEAMACGCIVFCSDIEANKNIVNNSENGFFIKNKENFENILERLTQNHQLEERVSSKATKYISKNFSLDNFVEKEFSVYEKITKAF